MDLLVDGSHCGRYEQVLEPGHLKATFKIIERISIKPAINWAVLHLLICPCCGLAPANALSALAIKANLGHSRHLPWRQCRSYGFRA